MSCRLAIVFLAALGLAQPPDKQAGLDPETLLLAKIKARAAENLERLPNYTCLEAIERSRRPASSRRFQLIDVVRLEVAYVNHKEMFAWPGSDQFEDRDITDLVSGGAIGNGSFALHARSVFLTRSPSFTYVGERIREGRSAVRFDYHVPLLMSGYKLRVKPLEGIVGYEGSFWADAASLDLIRLEVRVTEIPPHLPISSGTEFLEYARQRIGEGDFLLPLSSEMVLTDLRGNESRNRIRFSSCRQYAGESVLSFADAPEGPVEVKKPPRRIEIPPGIDLDLRLDTDVETGKSAVGDGLQATVMRDAKQKGQVVVPKGAVVSGRLVRLQYAGAERQPRWIAGLEFSRIEFENTIAPFHARMSPVTPIGAFGLTGPTGPLDEAHLREQPPGNPWIGILYLRGERGRIPAGTRLTWRTESHSSEEQK
jgi:hypothetical protein